MAELGDPFHLARDPNVDRIRVTDAMMDFSYVQESNNLCELKAILRALRSAPNKGQFIRLEQAVESKLMQMLPEKERRLITSISTTEPTIAETQDANKSLDSWLDSMKSKHVEIATTTINSDPKSRYLPPTRSYPVRGEETQTRKSNDPSDWSCCQQQAHPTPPQRISKETMSNRDYFAAWEKFDVEAVEEALDEADREVYDRSKALLQDSLEGKIQRAKVRHKTELVALQEKLKMNSLTHAERLAMAERERQKGNECYRCGENEEAIASYSKSIAFDGTNAIVYSNRAMAAIRLSYMEQALADTTMALELDPCCVKARARRGTIHHRCGRYANAIQDFERCLEQEPENQYYARLLKKSEDKLVETQGDLKHERTKTKLLIKETLYDEERENAATYSIKNKSEIICKSNSSLDSDLPNIHKFNEGPRDHQHTCKGEEASNTLDLSQTDEEVEEVFTPGARTLIEAEARISQRDNVSRGKNITGRGNMQTNSTDSFKSWNLIANGEQPVAFEPSNELKEKGNAALRNGQVEEAIRLYTLAINNDPKSCTLRNNRAMAYLKLERWELAEKDASLVLEAEPTNIKALYRRGFARMMQRTLDCLLQARIDFLSILALEPQNELVQKELRNCEALIEKEVPVDVTHETKNHFSDMADANSVSSLPGSAPQLHEQVALKSKLPSPQDFEGTSVNAISVEKQMGSKHTRPTEKMAQPMTAAEFEMVVRSLHSENDEKLFLYLQSLNKSCYKKVRSGAIMT
jgi:tetratricopeptide (TPR) repeat protein